MKNIFLFLFVLTLVSAEITISPAHEKHTVIFIYHSGKAVFHESRHAELNNSTSMEIIFTDLPISLVGDEVRVSSDHFIPYSTFISRNPINEHQLLSYFEGKKISLTKLMDDGTLSNPLPATLISYSHGQVVYGIEEKVVVNPKGMQPVFPYIPEELADLPNVFTIGESVNGRAEFLLSYFVDGLSWTASYHLNLSDSSHLILSGNYLLRNNSKSPFENMDVFLVSAKNRTDDSQKPPLPKRDAVFSAAFRPPAEPELPTLQDVEDYEIYHLEKSQNLPGETTVQAKLLPGTTIPFSREYIVSHRARAGYRQRGSTQTDEETWDPASLQLNIKTSDVLHDHLPPGTINIYQEVDGYPALIGEKSIATISKGNDIHVDLKKTQDILYQLSYTNQIESDDGRSITISGKFKNLKAEPVNVTWKEFSSSPFTISETTVEFIQADIFTAETILTLNQGETVEEQITLFFKKNK